MINNKAQPTATQGIINCQTYSRVVALLKKNPLQLTHKHTLIKKNKT